MKLYSCNLLLFVLTWCTRLLFLSIVEKETKNEKNTHLEGTLRVMLFVVLVMQFWISRNLVGVLYYNWAFLPLTYFWKYDLINFFLLVTVVRLFIKQQRLTFKYVFFVAMYAAVIAVIYQ